jgi:hypothetical protein
MFSGLPLCLAPRPLAAHSIKAVLFLLDCSQHKHENAWVAKLHRANN